MEFQILGSLDVIAGGRSVELRRAKPRAVLAMLLLHPNQVVSADRLIDALWGERPPASAANTLQGYVSHLRQALATVAGAHDGAPVIRTQVPGYTLAVDPDRIDAQRFERLTGQGRRALLASDYAQAAGAFGEALSLWRGPALADFAYERFASVEASRLQELRLQAIEEQTDAELALGRHGELVCRLQALVEEHPLRERLWGQFMLALYRCGRQAEALRAFRAATRTLGEELGIEPSPPLRRLEADILAQASYLEWEGRAVDTGTDGRRVPFPSLLAVTPSVAYVGRAQLLDHLTRARRAATGGTCRAVLLAGEPGVGKTRTAAEVARAAFAEGATVLYGHCDEQLAVPYQPFVEALDWYAAHAVEPVLGRYPAELTRLHPLLASQVAGLDTPVSSDPRTEEYRLFEATTSWLIDLARQQPLVLVLDDLHWASKPVLLLLRHALRGAAAAGDGVALLVIGTYRDTEVDPSHPLVGVVADVCRLVGVDRSSVVGLSLAEAEEFVSHAVGHVLDDDIRRLARTLHSETEGNPFFMGEVLRHLVETGTLPRPEDRPAPTELCGLTVPEGVREVVGRRIGRISKPARQVLSVAAVLGRDFDMELLAAVSDLPEETLLDALDESLGTHLIEETGADHYRFAHALVRATLTEDLSATRRCRLHLRVGEAVEKLRPDDVVALAHHFTEARLDTAETPRALRYTLAAADQALAARALADAETRFRTALTLLPEGSDTMVGERIEALCGLGEAQRDQGDPGFRATLLEAARQAREAGNHTLFIRAVLSNSRGVPSVIGGLDAERVALTEAALEAVDPGPSADRARLLSQLAAEITFTRNDARRLALADEAEQMARTLDDAALLAWVLNRTGYAAFHPRRVERLVARGEEATRLSDASADVSQRVLSRYFWSGALLTAGDLPAFRTVTEEMPAVAEEAAPTLQWLALATQARLCLIDGDSASVQRINNAAFQLAQELGEPDGPAWWAATLCPLEWHRGGMGRMVDVLRAGVDEYPFERAWSLGHTLALAELGRKAEAREALDRDPPYLDEVLGHAFPFFNALMVAEIAFHVDDADLAARTAEAIRPYRQCWAHQYAGTIGPLGFAAALCAATTGDLDEAVDLCGKTEADLVGFGCEGLLPHFRVYYAEILLRRGADDDGKRARDLLSEARRGAIALDAPDLVVRVDELALRSRR